ncbi:hypothetical protein FDE76_16225 [Clostridium botulinum]|uniref:Uncharacterized protein n=1 Tax=Clostridium botulinum (strain Eklund 17B / Type B) TaxID=935198 RepID=B2TJD7_CLOBB|nr:conserved hypothetical protein [Clostridium botulinum B str. Eklund 17B (NRP)]MBY6974824.1 hypothetical protein [Clostridium botulinum]MBY6999804.1 hypothetical protein [Clostridium botulinum]MCR1274576.1 hypothetical protein [Clostridium botulinum]NFD71649.1 hypothetical protein [Clostridium botulinum]
MSIQTTITSSPMKTTIVTESGTATESSQTTISNTTTNPIATEIIHKEIDLIESCITRMAQNSFLIKGWYITLLAAVIALFQKSENVTITVSIISIISVSFWGLNAFFLYTERKYRDFYEYVIVLRQQGNDKKLYSLKLTNYTLQYKSYWKSFFGKTICLFYFIPLILCAGVMLFNHFHTSI